MSKPAAESPPAYQSWSEQEIDARADVQPVDAREAAKDASRELREINGAIEAQTN